MGTVFIRARVPAVADKVHKALLTPHRPGHSCIRSTPCGSGRPGQNTLVFSSPRLLFHTYHPPQQAIGVCILGSSLPVGLGMMGLAGSATSIDALVIGAGIAGLAAASALHAQGFKVVVLEARDRIGGRLHSDLTLHPGVAIDLGGAWIHGVGDATSANAVCTLTQQLGLAMHLTDFADCAARRIHPEGGGSSLMNADEVQELEALYGGFKDFCDDLLRGSAPVHPCGAPWATQSVSAAANHYIAHRVAARQALSTYQQRLLEFALHCNIEHYWCGEVHEMALEGLNEVILPGGDAVLRGGYSQLTQHLAHGLDVRFGHVVQEIAYDVHGVSICTSQGSFNARCAIVTLPLGVMKDTMSVRFCPPLKQSAPAKAAAIERLGLGMYNKVILCFDKRFWDDAIFLLKLQDGLQAKHWAWWLNLDKAFSQGQSQGVPVLVGCAIAAHARELELLPDEQIKDEAMDALRTMYPDAVVPEPSKFKVTRWGQDPYSRMAYSFLPVGATMSDFSAMQEPIRDSLFFAGEATSIEYCGTVLGAYTSGLQAAMAVGNVCKVEEAYGGDDSGAVVAL